ncbi:MAG: metallophosphatase family protein [Anaerolineae bacterium]|nr:metallophosphatase family protein [Anaerolineae bacterium]
MRILLISDIHANLVAFEAVLEASVNQWDQVMFLGDLVGYGPEPNECVALMRQLPHVALSGNHDWAALGRIDIESFNANARQAMHWTQATLSTASYDYLAELPPLTMDSQFTYAHASPRDPVWEYVSDLETAAANFAHFETNVCFVGHTHVPVIFVLDAQQAVTAYAPVYGEPLSLAGTDRFIINPGSVGQPRDTDARAAYAVLDTDTVTLTHFRVAYDVAETQRRMIAHELPPPLIARLQYGF